MSSRSLDTRLMEPLSDAFADETAFASDGEVNGSYLTEQFVVRLAPEIHELVDAAAAAGPGAEIGWDTLQAYSTYLHETVHWWQHIGSTSGLIYSLQFPGMCLQAAGHLRQVLSDVGPIKPIDKWAAAQRASRPPTDPTLQAAHVALNNAWDMTFYKKIAFAPLCATALANNPYFEHVGHSYWMAYGNALALISATADRDMRFLPDGRVWDDGFRQLREEGAPGFAHGVPLTLPPIGLRALMEGQARFAQLQFLCMAANPGHTVSELRAQGQFDGRYGEAFDAFLMKTDQPEPGQFDSPIIALFMLILDLSINPTRGFPNQIETYETFLTDVDPGMRFLRLCEAAADNPAVFTAIRNYSRDEYVVVAGVLTRACGFDDPIAALETVSKWASEPTVAALLEERRTFAYDPGNLVVRVLFAYFVAFSQDKKETPEFFCWPGAWKAGTRVNDRSAGLWMKYLSLFTDKSKDEGVYPRHFPGVPEERLTGFITDFFVNVMVYDLTRQWIFGPGPFFYPFNWLSKRHLPEQIQDAARSGFKSIFDVDPEDFTILF